MVLFAISTCVAYYHGHARRSSRTDTARVSQCKLRLHSRKVKESLNRNCWRSKACSLSTGNLLDERSHPTKRRTENVKSVTCLFTGIVQGVAKVKGIRKQEDFVSLNVEFPTGSMDSVQIGGSVALNGTCLTVTEVKGDVLGFDIIMETLRATNLGSLDIDHVVNFERSARYGDEVGGHNVSGHVHCTAEITQMESSPNNQKLYIKVPLEWTKYILPKGYIAVNGCSLTIGEVEGDVFSLYLIPETLRVTIFSSSSVGDLVNIEIDTQTQTIVDTVERMLASSNALK